MVTEAKLQEDLRNAMRAREMQRVYVLRGVLTAVKNLKVEKQIPDLGEADLVAIVRREDSKRSETIAYAEKAGRSETVVQNQAEKRILEEYLPVQLNAAQLEAVVTQLAEELQTTEIGPLMSELRKRHAGTYDGKLASESIRRLQQVATAKT